LWESEQTIFKKKGIQFAFQLEDCSGSINEIADIMRKYEGRMVSILGSYEGVPEGYRKFN
jgi:acetoin utilization protein AcuB